MISRSHHDVALSFIVTNFHETDPRHVRDNSMLFASNFNPRVPLTWDEDIEARAYLATNPKTTRCGNGVGTRPVPTIHHHDKLASQARLELATYGIGIRGSDPTELLGHKRF